MNDCMELGFKLYIVLIFCGSVWTLVCIFVYIDVFYIDSCVGKWILMLTWCLKCYFKYVYLYICCNDKPFVYSFCIYDLKPISWILKSCIVIPSVKSCSYACIIWCFHILVSLYLFLYSWLLYCYPKFNKTNPKTQIHLTWGA